MKEYLIKKSQVDRLANIVRDKYELGAQIVYYISDRSKFNISELPNSLTSIGDYAFSYCYDLALTELPSGITSVGNYTFYNCTNLKTITFKGTPNNINSNTFSGCTNLTNINVPWAQGAVAGAPWGATNATINYNYKD